MTEQRHNEHEILRCRVGSRAHGTALPESDDDFTSIHIPSKREVIGITGSEIPHVQRGNQIRRFTKDDYSFSLRHFAKKAADCVPNILEMLFCREEDIVHLTEDGQRLRAARNIFVSKRCTPKYIGYAESQFSKISKKPENCGQGRTELIEKFGYDTKRASHAIRLLESAIDLLSTGHLNVWRPNSQYLISIRQGKAFTCYDEFNQHALALIAKLRDLDLKTKLPEKPDLKAIDDLVISIHESYWTKNMM